MVIEAMSSRRSKTLDRMNIFTELTFSLDEHFHQMNIFKLVKFFGQMDPGSLNEECISSDFLQTCVHLKHELRCKSLAVYHLNNILGMARDFCYKVYDPGNTVKCISADFITTRNMDCAASCWPYMYHLKDIH